MVTARRSRFIQITKRVASILRGIEAVDIAAIIAIVAWGALFFLTLGYYSFMGTPDKPYQTTDDGHFAIVSGIPVLCLWIANAIRRRSILLGFTVLGVILSLGFYVASMTENIGYTVRYEWYFYVRYIVLNPWLHLGPRVGGGEDMVYMNSMRPENVGLYLLYGELLAFLLLGLCIGLRRLSFRLSRSRLVVEREKDS